MRRSDRLFLCACLVTVTDCLVGMMQEDAQAPRTRNRDVRAARTVCATTAEAPGTQGRLLRVPPPLDPLLPPLGRPTIFFFFFLSRSDFRRGLSTRRKAQKHDGECKCFDSSAILRSKTTNVTARRRKTGNFVLLFKEGNVRANTRMLPGDDVVTSRRRGSRRLWNLLTATSDRDNRDSRSIRAFSSRRSHAASPATSGTRTGLTRFTSARFTSAASNKYGKSITRLATA